MGWEQRVAELGAHVALESEKTRLAFAQAMAQTQRALRIDGALPVRINPNSVNYTAGGRLVGWSLRAAAGDVIVNLRDGHDVGGDVIATLTLTNGASANHGLPGSGVSFVESLYAEVTGAGAAGLVGSVWIGAVD